MSAVRPNLELKNPTFWGWINEILTRLKNIRQLSSNILGEMSWYLTKLFNIPIYEQLIRGF